MTDETKIPPEISPNRYIEKVELASGEVLEDEILPRQLLVHNHRDYHIVDIHAHYMMGRVVKATGDENWAYEKMKRMRRLGSTKCAPIAPGRAKPMEQNPLGIKQVLGSWHW